jgi:AcrR family transcriptional regulator
MLNELGFMDLTIEGVAARAEVGKPTIYRRWQTKSALAVELVMKGVSQA